MATLTTKSANGTSFHGHTVTCTVRDLMAILGEPQGQYNTGEDKTNFDWDCETDGGDVFTLYDWKIGRALDLDEYVKFHVGAVSPDVSYQAMIELNDMLFLAFKEQKLVWA